MAASPTPDSESEPDVTQYDASSNTAKSTGKSSLPETNGNGTYDLSAGQQLGEFCLMRRLGRGGMAEVWLAEQTSLNRQVAIKVLRPELMIDPSYRQRFQTEAKAVAGLNHANIVQVYTVGEVTGRFFIAQEYVNGQNLKEFLNRKGPPEFPVAIHIIRQVAAALQAANDAGIVHRDIKPENIMLTRKGEVKVADFGLAKRSSTTESQELTQIGTTMGTPLYMSPEQINGTKVDQRSDLYSFGVTCYHMLAGQPPFRGETAITVAMQHLKKEAAPLEDLREDLPPLLCRIVHKLMEKLPEHRYQSAKAVLQDLKRLSQEQNRGAHAQPSEEARQPAAGPSTGWLAAVKNPGPSLVTLADWPWKKQWPRLVACCLVLALISGGLGWAARPANPLTATTTASTTTPPTSQVPKFDTPTEQFFHASALRNDPQAWQAVVDNFPDDRVFTPNALTQLGLLYLAQNRLPEAQLAFQKLIDYGSLDPQNQAQGYVGQALVLNQQEKFEESQRMLIEHKNLWTHLMPRLRDLARRAGESNATHLRQSMDDELLRRLSPQEGPPIPNGPPPPT